MGCSQVSCVERDDLLALAPFLWQFYKQFYKASGSTFVDPNTTRSLDPTVANRAGRIFYTYILETHILERGIFGEKRTILYMLSSALNAATNSFTQVHMPCPCAGLCLQLQDHHP